ncbi:MAG: cohesin domain-containing protein [Candidatus Bathyarchaeia archaeon]
MNSKLSKAIMILVAAMLLVNAAPFMVNAQPPYGTMSMAPSAVSLTTANPEHTIGYKFKITVSLDMSSVKSPATGIQGWQFNLTYPTAYLDVVRYAVTNNNITSELFAGLVTLGASFSLDEAKGYIMAAEATSTGYVKPVPCSGSLVWIEFMVTAVPGKNEVLSGSFSFSKTETYVADDQFVYYYAPDDIAVSGATYTFEWQPPAPAYMSVEHDGSAVWPLVYGPYPPPAVGETFNAEIYVNVAEAWGLTSASFCLCFNDTVIDTSDVDIAIDPAWTGTATLTETPEPEVLARIDFAVAPVGSVGGKVLVATVKFTVILQQLEGPEYPFGYYDSSPLDFCDVEMQDHVGPITVGPSVNGEVRVYALTTLPFPYVEVSPKDTVIEPAPCNTVLIGKEFTVDIVIKNLHERRYLAGYQIRVTYDPELLEVVDVIEGPFLQDSRWNLYGTFWVAYVEPPTWMFPAHVMFADLLLWNPDTGEYDQTVWPSAPGPDVPDLVPPVNPVLATIKFKVLKQEGFGGDPLTGAFDILPFWKPENCHFVDRDGNFIPTDTAKCVNGTVTIMPMVAYGRMIDVYGGAVNRGYGAAPFPAPYGGQGLNQPMDLVIPQSVVYLYAKVTYNCWPVQSKDVGFEIEGPFGTVKYTNRTGEDGVAWIKFQMPWPCENPEQLLGVYTVTTTVDICGVVVSDTLQFKYDYLVNIVKVTTDKYEYVHDENVKVTIELTSKAYRSYSVLLSVVIQDELETHFATAIVGPIIVGGAEFCTEKTYTVTANLNIPKWAFAGIAKIFVSAYDKDPTEGGAPWCPGATTEICILPM